MDVVLIPAYEPDAELIKLVKGLSAEGFTVLVVNDGSGEKFDAIFEESSAYATVIALPKNSGKGAALKFGMAHIRDNMPECENFITCDADGQHRIEDVKRVRDRLHVGDHFVLTTRKKNKKAPFRSRFGNSLSRFVYAILTSRYLSDNQSGLRGFSRIHLDWLINVEKNNYDYEMNVLYYASKMGVKISTLTIEAIYIGNNESSHFSPVKDTIKIYRSLFKLARGSFFGFFTAEILVFIASFTLGYEHLHFVLPTIGAVSYMVCSILNALIFFRKIPKFDYKVSLLYTVLSYFIYTLMCIILGYVAPWLPLIVSFNVCYLYFIPIKYLLHKFTFIAMQTKD